MGRDGEEVKVMGRSRHRPVVNQLAQPPPPEGSVPDCKTKELQEKVEVSQNLIDNLQSEVLGLKAELEKAQSVNLDLQSLNAKLTEDLAAALAKINVLTNLTSRQQVNPLSTYTQLSPFLSPYAKRTYFLLGFPENPAKQFSRFAFLPLIN